MEKHLENLHWTPRMVSHLGCIKGCLDFIGMDVSDAWLFGTTGHAFIINICERDVCPSGPTAWNTQELFRLGTNAGYRFVNGILAFHTQEDFSGKQRQAYEGVVKSLDAGIPCYGWELEAAEFYVVSGYDDTGYYYSGPGTEQEKGPKLWQELGTAGTGILELYGVTKGEAAADTVAVKQALEFALRHAENPAEWIYSDYRSGLAGWDLWIESMERGEDYGFGIAYNAAVWTECRALGLKFLDEAKDRLDPQFAPLFDEAIERYFPVVDGLSRVVSLFPLAPPEDRLPEMERYRQGVEALKEARLAEEKALDTLRSIVRAL